MKKEVKYSIRKLTDACSRLQDGIDAANNELGRDGVIKRFEFTFELLWKALKLFLLEEGIICKSPKDCLQQAFKYGLVEDEEIFLDMLEDRNLTTHTYDQKTSDKIYNNIKNRYVQAIMNLNDKMKTD
ncbi:MAG: nucleotidyltransferase substrate binding protein [Melioribacteraceae bacterium]|nr:nucleotidyltransferase substrate binding protein [Melioribacteraceae bacterium]MCF8355980.1 nucleotidyltransferase substrate binding protein [Melioribacteraceae bacterium]MCF8394614.1 nucleotidyltransferase substrate binding protein [Melioribacteraceae bacterium]MCF8419611.1 nucleotidyltransferase substrate binding protein [Melioribacteraceae bacterium]